MADHAKIHGDLIALLPSLASEVFGSSFETEQKGSDGLDLVTSIDFELQRRLESELASLLPRSAVHGEEGYAAHKQEGYNWLVDPLDGTVNFVAALPCYAIAVVLFKDETAQVAAVYDVVHGTMYSAVLGEGAFIDGTPITTDQSNAKLCIMSSGLLNDLAQNGAPTLVDLLSSYKLRNFGSQALHLCYVAAGKVSFVASREAKGWDDIAGALIAQEAGLKYGHYGPRPSGIDENQMSLCTAPELFSDLAHKLSNSIE